MHAALNFGYYRQAMSRGRALALSLAAAVIVLAGAATGADGFQIVGNKWGDPALGTPGGTVTYSFAPSDASCAVFVSACQTQSLPSLFGPGIEAVLGAAFQSWSAIADIDFVQVADLGGAMDAAAGGQIRIGAAALPSQSFLAETFPGAGSYAPILVNSAYGWELAADGVLDGVFDILTVLTHEIGHAIGLDHENAVVALMNSTYTEAFGEGLGPDDIAGARFIYGVRTAVPGPATLVLVAAGLAIAALRVRPRHHRPH